MVATKIKGLLLALIVIIAIILGVTYYYFMVKPKEELVTINVLLQTEFPSKFYNEILPAIEKKLNIKINWLVLPYTQFVEKLRIALTTHSGDYDIVFMNDDWYLEYLPHLEPLNAWMQINKDDWYLVPYNFATLSGSLKLFCQKAGEPYKSLAETGYMYQLPFFVDVFILQYRTDLFEQVGGPPTDWNDLLQKCAALKMMGLPYKIGVWGLGVRGFYSWYVIYLSLERERDLGLLDENLLPAWNSTYGYEAMRWLYDAMNTYEVVPKAAIGWDIKECNELFWSGEAAALFSWAVEQSLDPNVCVAYDKVDIAVNPYFSSHLGMWGFAISRDSKHKDIAAKVLDELSGEAMYNFCAETVRIAPIRTVQEKIIQEKPTLSYQKFGAKYEEAIQYGRPHPQPIPEFAQIQNILVDEIHKCLLGEKTPKQAMDDAAARASYVLLRYR